MTKTNTKTTREEGAVIPPPPPVSSVTAPAAPYPPTSSNRKPKYYEVSEWIPEADRLILWNRNNNRQLTISKEDFLRASNIADNLIPVETDYAAAAGEKLLIKATRSLTITLPPNPNINDRIKLVGATNFFDYPLKVNTNGQPFEGTPVDQFRGIELIDPYQSGSLVFAGGAIGWISAPRLNWSKFGVLPEGYRLFIEGSLEDKSPLKNPVNKLGLTLPIVSPRINNKPGLVFNGTDQRLSIPTFMNATTGATVYAVYAIDGVPPYQYTLLRTNNGIDDYTKHGNNNSYPSLFMDRRIEGYHAEPAMSGTNLVSWHVASNRFQMIQNGKNYGIKAGFNYSPGNCFELCTYPFKGAIMSLLVYPYEILPESDQHKAVVDYFYKRYPALRWTGYIP